MGPKSILLVAIVFSFLGYAETRVVPMLEHHQSALRGGDCSLYRAMVTKTRKQISENRSLGREIRGKLGELRFQVEACGKEKGLTGPTEKWDEATLAELCEWSYDEWLSLGYRYHGLMEEVVEENSGLELLILHLNANCGRLPSTLATAY